MASEKDQYDLDEDFEILSAEEMQLMVESFGNDPLPKLDDIWQQCLSFRFVDEMFLLAYILVSRVQDKEAQKKAFIATQKGRDYLSTLDWPLTVEDYYDIVAAGGSVDPNAPCSSVFIYAKNAMKDIQRFGNKPADFLPEPFFSYLRDGMVSKLTYKEACEIVKNSTRFSAKSYGIMDALKQVRVLRKSFVEAFNQFTFLKDGSKESKKILAYKKKFLQVYSYESMFAVHAIHD